MAISDERKQQIANGLAQIEAAGGGLISKLTASDWLFIVAALVVAFLIGKFA